MTLDVRELAHRELDRLSEKSLPAALERIRALQTNIHPRPTVRTLSLSVGGSIDTDEMDRIDAAIQEAFEVIEPD